MADENGQVERGREIIARLTDELLPTLIARLEASQLGELEVRQNGWRVRVRRTPAAAAQPHAGPAPGPSRRGERRGERQPPSERPAHEQSNPRPHSLRAERDRRAITSPAVGYYLPRDGVGPGTTMRAGDVLGHVDVLGVRQDVVAPDDGVLVTMTAEAGEAVEYGQVVARIEPVRSDSEGRPEADVAPAGAAAAVAD